MKSYVKILLLVSLLIGPALVSGSNDRTITYFDTVSNNPTTRMYSIEDPEIPVTRPTVGGINDPVTINFPPSTDGRNVSIFRELNSSYSEIWFQIKFAQDAFVKIDLKPLKFDPVIQDIGFDVLGPDMEFIQSSFDEYAPVQSVEFPIVSAGFYKILVWGVGAFDEATGSLFSPGENIPFKLTIFEFAAGEGPAGGNVTVITSEPTNKITNILQFLVNQTYIVEPNAGIYNVGRLNPNTSGNYAKAVGSTVYGLLRAGDYMSRIGIIPEEGAPPPTEDLDALLPFFMVSYNLVGDLMNTRVITVQDNIDLNDQLTLAYSAPDSSNVNLINDITQGTISFSLEDNTYLLMAMLELNQLLPLYIGHSATPFITPQFISDFQSTLNDVANSTVNFFWNGTYFFEDVYLNATKNLSGIYDVTTARNFSRDFVNLESLALISEILDRVDELSGIPNFTTTIEGIINFIKTNMIVKSVSYTTLNDFGVAASSIFLNNLTKSNEADLLGNTYLASILTPVNSRPDRSWVSMNESNDLATNILTLFTSPKTGLLYDVVDTTTTVFEKKTSVLNQMQFASYIGRLAGSWKDQTPFYGEVVESISRSWTRRSIELQNALELKMYDTSKKAFFAQFDETSGLLLADDDEVNMNQFVANAMAMAQQIKVFPVNIQSLTQDVVAVNELGQISVKISKLELRGPWIWFNPDLSFEFDLTVSIPSFGYTETRNVDLFDIFFGTGGKVNSFFFEPTKRGEFTVDLVASKEGQILLQQELKITALGEVHAEMSQELSFATDENSFKAVFSLIDENGLAVQNLQVNASLVEPLDKTERDGSIFSTDRSDSSGEIELTFDVSKFEEDYINRTYLSTLDKFPEFIFIDLFANVTNLDSNDLTIPEGLISIPVKVILAKTIVQISPTNLVVTEGTTESFSFSVNVYNQELDPIVSARVFYRLEGQNFSVNSVLTDADGSATITIRDLDLQRLRPPSINISFTILHESYPTRTLTRVINVLDNGIRIIANPVQYSLKGKTIFESSLSSIDVEVAAEDFFGQSLTAMVFLRWADPNVNSYVDVENFGERISPYTFTLDPTNLPAGTYRLEISAWRDGLVSRDNPTQITRTIIITDPTFYDSIASAVLIYGAFITSKIIFLVIDKVKKLIGLTVECPHCRTDVNAKASNCSACGNPLKLISKDST